MTDPRILPPDILEIRDRLDEVIVDANYEGDVRRSALVALDLCDLLRPSLSGRQMLAVEAARSYWSGAESAEFEQLAEECLRAIRATQHLAASGNREFSITRLVFAATNRYTEFSSYTCEFQLGLGYGAGLTADQMRGVFRAHVPEF